RSTATGNPIRSIPAAAWRTSSPSKASSSSAGARVCNPEIAMLIAHITDTHITAPGTLLMGIVDTASALERAVASLNRLDPSPDITVLTGDLVESGASEEYAHLRALLAPLRMPVFAIPGNHDAREPMREAFIGDGYLPRQG